MFNKIVLFGFVLSMLAVPVFPKDVAAPESLTYGRFGTVALYRESPHPRHVVLFFSGDGGWNQGVVEMAKILAGMDSVVAGINVPHYLKQLAASKETCSYPAADLEALSKLIQKKLGFPSYVTPVLVGYSSGATLVYAALVQAPPNTFRGAISMGFCPDLPLRHPFCEGHGLKGEPGPQGKGISFLPTSSLEQPWIAFQGESDKVCFKDDVVGYASKVKGSEVVLLPQVGHGFGKQARWVPQFRQSFRHLVGAEGAATQPAGSKELEDLPLVEVPPRGTGGDALAVILSGDGGWAGLDREVAAALAGKGVPVVGLDSLRYFWTARTPDGAARDLERILRHYLAVWNRKEALLIGYSLGAEVLPFLANRLPADLLDRVGLIALLGPERSTSFEFHVSEWLGVGGGSELPVLPEVKKLAGRRLLCLYGSKEDDSLCPEIAPSLGRVVALSGAHHFGGDYESVASLILREKAAH
ncbi:MAG TPA: AcvB/VirJ family lysyl-phosphatidylglycerol hydrolase [Thermoanaerobaculia bacterium]|nr:AcvB/VirJ family lysyl-phosphatidylglycerol hydrolase [Thermoanaerobaculia bacterium]